MSPAAEAASARSSWIGIVPAGHFFAIGDNRENSKDSRFQLGFVPLDNLVGRAEFVYFSRAPDAPGWRIVRDHLARWERMLKAVN